MTTCTFSKQPLYRDLLTLIVAVVFIFLLIWQGTTLYQAQQAQQRSEERFTLAVQASAAGLWVWDVTDPTLSDLDQHVWYSDSIPKLLGYSTTEWTPSFASFIAILHPDDVSRVTSAIQVYFAARGTVPYEIEYRLRDKEGNYHWYFAKGAALFDVRGNPTRMAGTLTCTDNSHNERLRAVRIVDATPIPIIACDEDRTITIFNQAAEAVTGFSTNEMIGKTIDTLLEPEFVEDHRKIVARASTSLHNAKNESTGSREVSGVLVRKDGSRVDVKLTLAGFKVNKRIEFVAAILVLNDVSTLKQAPFRAPREYLPYRVPSK